MGSNPSPGNTPQHNNEFCSLHQQVNEDFREVFERLRTMERELTAIEVLQKHHEESIKDSRCELKVLDKRVSSLSNKLLLACGAAAGVGAALGGEVGTIIMKLLKHLV